MQLFLEILEEMLSSLYPLIGCTLVINFGLIAFRIIYKILGASSCNSGCVDLEDVECEKVVEDCEEKFETVEFVENDSIIKYY